MLDLNAMFGEFLSKAVAEAVAQHTTDLKDRIHDLEQQLAAFTKETESEVNALQTQVDDVFDKMHDFDNKVDECDVERMIENSVEEYMRGCTEESSFVSGITESDEFETAVLDVLLRKLQA